MIDFLSNFKDTHLRGFRQLGLNVPRSRFLPVKKTSDLLLVMSNLYNLKNGSLAMSPLRSFPSTPLIKLGDNHFAKVGYCRFCEGSLYSNFPISG